MHPSKEVNQIEKKVGIMILKFLTQNHFTSFINYKDVCVAIIFIFPKKIISNLSLESQIFTNN